MENKPNSLTMLSDGSIFDFDNPDINTMSPYRLGYGLNNIDRWNGHAKLGSRWVHIDPALRIREDDFKLSMTDLHHSVLVFLIAKHLWPNDTDLHIQALLHDAGEVFYGDFIGPLKKRFKHLIKPIEDSIESLIAKRFNSSFPWDCRIKKSDMIAQDIEGYLCFPCSVVGVNVISDSIPSFLEENLFWEAYDFSVEKFIAILEKLDIIK